MSRIREMLVLMLAMAWSSSEACAEGDVSPLSLVSESAALCLEVPHFEETWSRFHRSQLAKRLKSFPPVQRFLSGLGFQKWTSVEGYVRRTTGKSLSEQLLGAFSESILVAVYLPDGEKAQGVLIGQARNEDALKQALQSWITLDPNHVTQDLEHHGQSYVRRAKSATSSEIVYYATFGRTFVLSDHESLIQEAIDRRTFGSRKPAAPNAVPLSVRALSESTLYLSNRARLPRDGAGFLYLNARAWDRALDNAIRHSPDAALIRSAFETVAAMAISLRLDNEVIVDVVADISANSRSPSWRQFIAATQRVGDGAARIPPEAIVAIASRMDVRPLIQKWLTVIPESKSREFARGRRTVNSAFLGRDFFLEILPDLLRDWTVSLALADQSSSDDVPVEIQGRFSVARSTTPDRTIERSLDNGLHFGMTLAAAYLSFQNSEIANPAVVSTELTDAGIVRSMAGLRAWSPSYLIGPESLTIATTRSALLRTPAASQSRNARLTVAEHRYFAEATQLIWLDAVRLRELLARHGTWIAGQIAPGSASAREPVQIHLASMGEVLKLMDAAFVAAKFDDDHVYVVFGAAVDRDE